MRLHNFLEELSRTTTRNPQYVEGFVEHCADCVQFDFGDVTDIPGEEWKGLQDYGVDLLRVGKFALPFKDICYSYKADDVEFLSVCNIAVEREKPDTPLLFMSLARWFNGAIIGLDSGFLELPKLAATGMFEVLWQSIIDRHEGISELDYETQLMMEARNIIALTCLLHANGLETRIEPAPEKLNKARARKGKPPIGEIRTVRIKLGEKTYAASGKETGTHASPRLHWRRGHVRRLPSGEITNVRPCLVGSADLGRVDHDHYAVERV